MRKSFDGLSGLVKNILERDPFHGDVFIFINKRRDKIKLLHWQGVSFSLYYKRLEKGTFELPQYDAAVKSIALSYTQMVMIVDGLTVSNIHKRKQYRVYDKFPFKQHFDIILWFDSIDCFYKLP